MAEEGYKWTGWEEGGAIRRKYGGFGGHMRSGDKVVLTVNWCLTFAWLLSWQTTTPVQQPEFFH